LIALPSKKRLADLLEWHDESETVDNGCPVPVHGPGFAFEVGIQAPESQRISRYHRVVKGSFEIQLAVALHGEGPLCESKQKKSYVTVCEKESKSVVE
jgi:hypothetical protein